MIISGLGSQETNEQSPPTHHAIQTYYMTHNSWAYQNHGHRLIQSSLCVCFQSEWSWISRDSTLHPPSIRLLKHCLLGETQKANSRACVTAFWKNRSSTCNIWTFRKAMAEVVLIDLWPSPNLRDAEVTVTQHWQSLRSQRWCLGPLGVQLLPKFTG